MGVVLSTVFSERKFNRMLLKNTRLNLLVDEWEDPKRPLTPPDEHLKKDRLVWNPVLEDNRAFFAEDEPTQVTLRKEELVWEPSDSEDYDDDEEGIDSDEELRQQAMGAGGSRTVDELEDEMDEEGVFLPGTATISDTTTVEEPQMTLGMMPGRTKSGGLQLGSRPSSTEPQQTLAMPGRTKSGGLISRLPSSGGIGRTQSSA